MHCKSSKHLLKWPLKVLILLYNTQKLKQCFQIHLTHIILLSVKTSWSYGGSLLQGQSQKQKRHTNSDMTYSLIQEMTGFKIQTRDIHAPLSPLPHPKRGLTLDCMLRWLWKKDTLQQKAKFVLKSINHYIFLCYKQPVIHCTVANLPNSVWSKYNVKQTYMMISIEFSCMPKSDRRSISPSLKSVLGFEYPNCSAWYSTYLLATST